MLNDRYTGQVQLLIDILPAVAEEDDFALKGGTAINLFYRNLPRLSVDIDLTFVPVMERDDSLAAIDAAMDRIATLGRKIQGVQTERIQGGSGNPTRVLFKRGGATIKVETSPVTRGVVFEPETRRVTKRVEDQFGFAETTVVAFEDLYAGKLVAALDRQHPRDLFDVKLLFENEGLTDDLFRVFLVYIASSRRPPHELLNPNMPSLERTHEIEFAGMTFEDVSLDELIQTRARLVTNIQQRLTGEAAQFLKRLVDAEPDFSLIGLPKAANLPAIRWKLQNLDALISKNPVKHRSQKEALLTLLAQAN